MKRNLFRVGLLALLCSVSSAFALTGDGNHITVKSGVVAFTGLVTAAEGGTGANNTATTGRYLRANGTTFVTSSVAAAGAGSCTNQFVRATVDNATPTCAAVSLTLDVSGILPSANGGTGIDSSTAVDDQLLVNNGTVWQLKTLTTCTGAGKAVTYDAATNAFGCNTITAGTTPPLFFGPGMDVGTSITLFLGLSGAADQTEGVVAAPSPGASYTNLRGFNHAIQGIGNNVTLTGQTGTCGSALSGAGSPGTITCTISGGAANTTQTCTDTTNTISPTAGQCIDFKLSTPATLTADAHPQFVIERTS